MHRVVARSKWDDRCRVLRNLTHNKSLLLLLKWFSHRSVQYKIANRITIKQIGLASLFIIWVAMAIPQSPQFAQNFHQLCCGLSPSFTPNHCIFYLNDLISSGSGLCLPFQNHRGTVLQCPTSKLIGHKLHLLMKPHIVVTYFSPSLPSSLHPSLPLSLSLSLALCPLIIFKMPLPI